MKFKNKIDIQYKYLLIYLFLILQAEAARPFSSGSTRSNVGSGIRSYGTTSSFGNTRSNFGSGTGNDGSTSSIGNTRTNFGSGSTSLMGSNIGTTNYNTGWSSQSNKPFISIADSKRALLSGSNTPQTFPSTNSGFSSTYKSSGLRLPNESTKPVNSIADGKKNLGFERNTAQNFPSTKNNPTDFNSQSNKPIIRIADAETNLHSGSKVSTNLNIPTKQPAYNPYFNAGAKVQASKNIDGPLIQQTAFGAGNQLPTAPNYDANTLSKQSAYTPIFSTVPKTQVPNSKDENSQPKQPAYNPFYNTGTNESPNFTTSKQPPYNPSFHEMNTQTVPAGSNHQPPYNAEHTSNVKNITNNINKSILQRMLPTATVVNNNFNRVTEIPKSNTNNMFANKTTTNIIQIPPIGHFNNLNFTKNSTNTTNTNFSTTPMDYINNFKHLNAHDNKAQDNKIPSKNGYKRAKIVHNYLKGNKAMLSHTSSILGLKGYTVGAVQQLNHLKTQQELNKALKTHKPNYIKRQIPVIIAVVIIISIVGGIIIFLKVKK
ncbi:probable serine/threonine-protein kinase clkA isoform X2 [Calliphora vicina]|uniref:probable serine/threonine-protein kinase clkA isoform X2 n=1 Tax=Calliphora vicina TaxID=7373 RepID=UPI00325AABDD